MTTEPSPYIPISCELHDRLEDLATLRKPADIRYPDDAGVEQLCNAVITDVYARQGADYMALNSGVTVRLDRLLEADGYKSSDFPPHCELD